MSAFNTTLASLDCDDETLRHHLQGADIPTLLMTVAHLTGDLEVLKPEWTPVIAMGLAGSGMNPEGEAQVRAFCLARLQAFRDSGQAVPPRPTTDQLHVLGTWLMGPVIEPYLPLIAEEVVTAEEDLRTPTWHKQHVAPGREFKVVIIGAGESGMTAALRFKQAGVPFVVYEKGDDVGGTWRENTYPGCRVDINSFFYSFSYARHSWDDCFAPAAKVFGYLQAVARENGLYEHIQFNTEVTDARWDETAQRWQLTRRDRAGQAQADSCHVVVFAVGQLNRPMIPQIPGLEKFEGPAFHSAQWDHGVDWSGKRVGVIGTGASATQFIPQLARTAANLKVFARTTNWLLPTPELHEKISPSTQWLLAHLPHYSLWYRAALAMPQGVGFLDDVTVDVDYPPTEVAVSARNELLRQQISAWMEPQFADRPDLRDVLIPDSPVGGKRIVRDNGTWISTLKRDNVSMIRQPIEAITPKGICCVDGTEHEFDLIVYGTGFHASKFLMPIHITGRDGVVLREVWKDDDARAYLGVSVPQFPNLFCMYGPNTGLVVCSTIIQFSELTANYIVDAVRLLLEGGHQSMEVKTPVFESYNQRIDQANGLRAWGFSKVNSWYKNSKGRVTQNFPFSAVEFWRRTHQVESTDYHFQ